MGFDDLARHMAGRDKKKLSTAATADELVAEAAVADRRLSRQRDLIAKQTFRGLRASR